MGAQEVEHSINNLSLSFIVTTFNSRDTLCTCLSSILNLRSLDNYEWEIIVIDDGSKDSSIEIANSFGLKVIRKRHGGYPSALNTGIAKAKGEVVVIVDSDVCMSPDWLTKTICEFNDPLVGMVGGNVLAFPSSSFWSMMAGYELEYRLARIHDKYVDHLSSTCTAYRKELFDKCGGFNEELTTGCDMEISHRALAIDWKIVLAKEAICYHLWKTSVKNYFVQQINYSKYLIKFMKISKNYTFKRNLQPINLYIPLLLAISCLFIPFFIYMNNLIAPIIILLSIILYHLPITFWILKIHNDARMILFPIAINIRYFAWIIGILLGFIDNYIM